MFKSTIAKRIFFGSILILVFTGLFLLDGFLSVQAVKQKLNWSVAGLIFTVMAIVLITGAVVELNRLERVKGINSPLLITLLTVAIVAAEPYWGRYLPVGNRTAGLAFVILAGLFFTGLTQALTMGTNNTIVNLAGACLTIIYLGVGCWFVLAIRFLGIEKGSLTGQVGPFFLFVACVKSSDIGAYFTGKFFGRHKLVPSISPGKTWEGLAGAIIWAMIVASLFALASGIINVRIAILFGFMMAVVGQMGDLLESMFKRDAAIKDSAHILPEFGGVLDVLDSILASAPLAYIILYTYGI